MIGPAVKISFYYFFLLIAAITFQQGHLEAINNLTNGIRSSLHFSPKVVGGTEAEPYEFPWIAYIKARTLGAYYFDAPGSLISSDCVLTAGSLNHKPKVTAYDLFLGSNDKNDPNIQSIYYVTDFYNYEQISVVEAFYPVIIKLPKNVNFTEKLYPIRIPSVEEVADEDYADETVTIAGWGHTSDGNFEYPDKLYKAKTTAITNEECNLQFNCKPGDEKCIANEYTICTSGANQVGFCFDFGAPVNYYDEIKGRWTAIGMNAANYEQCEFGLPGINLRLKDPELLRWIEGLCGPTGLPGLSTTTTAKPGFTCPSSSGIFPDPDDCTKFYQCSNYNPTNYKCPGDMVFNSDLLVCDFPENYPDCVVP